MRIVYDDSRQKDFTNALEGFISGIDIKDLVRYEWGTDRVQMAYVREKLNGYLKPFHMEIGRTVTHANGIGNNCMYPVYYCPEDTAEIQHCAYINLNTGMFGEGYLSCEDYNGKLISPVYEFHTYGIKRKQTQGEVYGI